MVWVDPKTLTGNPSNWKKHPHRQRQAFAASHSVNGWAGALLWNEVTERLLDGHMRREEALKKGIKSVPVLIGRWSEEQERHILATLDPIGSMYETQASALSALTEGVSQQLEALKGKANASIKDTLTKLNADIDGYATDIESGEAPSILLERKRDRREYDRHRSLKDEKAENHEEGIYRTEMAEDPVFTSTNAFGLPDIKADVLCPDPPTTVWDRSPETSGPDAYYCYSAGPSTLPAAGDRNGGTLGFFTEDFRFETCWNDVSGFTKKLRDFDFRGVLVPDFSTWGDWPLAVRIHQLYKSRYVARYWQEAGIPIIPIVQSIGLTDFDDDKTQPDETLSASICLHTIPVGCPVLATEARNSQGEDGYWPAWTLLHKLALVIIKPKHLVIYGGEENAKNFLARLPKTKTKITLLSSFVYRRRKGDKK